MKTEKRIYQKPCFDVVELEPEDIIALSQNPDEDDNQGEWDPIFG